MIKEDFRLFCARGKRGLSFNMAVRHGTALEHHFENAIHSAILRGVFSLPIAGKGGPTDWNCDTACHWRLLLRSMEGGRTVRPLI